MPQPSGKRRVAVHEAGHAVLARHVSDTIHNVEISDGSRFNGATRRTTFMGETQYTSTERFILVALAGFLAEQLVFGDCDENYCFTDQDQAWEAAAGHVVITNPAELAKLQAMSEQGIRVQDSQWARLPEAISVFQRLEAECRAILAINRPDLDALTAHLEQYGRCEGQDIIAICAGTWKLQAPEGRRS